MIGGQRLDGKLAMISTTSALGRSSIYNRLRFDGRLLYESVGFTRGAGEFHFSNGLYRPISDYAERYCEPTAKAKQWGTGFRNRREVIKKVLTKVGISTEWLYHGVQREVFWVCLHETHATFWPESTQGCSGSTYPQTYWPNISDSVGCYREHRRTNGTNYGTQTPGDCGRHVTNP